MPDGEATELRRSQMVTTWTDDEGGTLTLKPDGTFAAHDVCGDYDVDPYAPENEPRSGSGTWDQDDWDGQTSLSVSFDTGDVRSRYEALRHGKVLKLWTYVGDPDSPHPLCVLTNRSR
ncbi:hypothetical protein [Streptomyces sp. NPDC012510]|uniref:hypothetical protein n=1 Tax=Streptomyces sp. NPDC012510 TaxID=3364838 RepID=UPI0036EE3991